MNSSNSGNSSNPPKIINKDLASKDLTILDKLEEVDRSLEVFPEEWGLNTPEKKAQIAKSKKGAGVKHGLLATIPMICRDEACPYKMHCIYQQRGEVTAGERCVLEIGKLMKASEQYYNEFKVDPNDPEHRTDAVLIQQLLILEILLERCNMLLASGNLVEEIDVAISPTGDVISQPQLHKAVEALPRLQRRQNEVLQLLSATRKDKLAAAASIGMSIDQFTKQLIDRAQVVEARLHYMRQGGEENLDQATKLGVKYAMDVYSKDLELDLDIEQEEIPVNPNQKQDQKQKLEQEPEIAD